MSQEIDYASVLADLEAKKAAIEAAIDGIRQVLGQAAGDPIQFSRPGAVQGVGVESKDVEAGDFHGMSIAQAAKKFLGMVKTKQSTGSIAGAIRKGGIETTAKNFYSNVYSILQRDKDFTKMGTFWGLSEWYPTRATSGSSKPRAKRKAKRAMAKKPSTSGGPAGPRLLRSGDEKAGQAKDGVS